MAIEAMGNAVNRLAAKVELAGPPTNDGKL